MNKAGKNQVWTSAINEESGMKGQQRIFYPEVSLFWGGGF